MQPLNTFFEENKPLAFVIMFAVLLVVIIVLFLLYRLIFGRRLKASTGARTRQPRLGIVDAFDLDRQRQLVLIRRDNVEHLIMIGGPNDLVVESSIVRAQSVASMSPGRDKDTGASMGGLRPADPACDAAVRAASCAGAPDAARRLGLARTHAIGDAARAATGRRPCRKPARPGR